MQTLFRALAGVFLLCAALFAMTVAHVEGAPESDATTAVVQSETDD